MVFEIRALTDRQTLEDGLRRHSIDVDAFANSTACCDLDLWAPESNRVISRGYLNIPAQFHRDCSSRLWDRGNKICPDVGGRTNDRMNAADGQPENISAFAHIVGWRIHNNRHINGYTDAGWSRHFTRLPETKILRKLSLYSAAPISSGSSPYTVYTGLYWLLTRFRKQVFRVDKRWSAVSAPVHDDCRNLQTADLHHDDAFGSVWSLPGRFTAEIGVGAF